MAKASKIVAGLIASSCLHLATTCKAQAQAFADLDMDRTTINSTLNLQRVMPLPSDLVNSPDANSGKVSPTNDPTIGAAPPSVPSPASAEAALKPAISLPVATTSNAPVSTSTGPYFDLPARTSQTDNEGRALAQAPPSNPDLVPIDTTPVRLPERNNTFTGFDAFSKTNILYKLPSRFFFDLNVENSLRFEVNTFQTNRHYLSDMIYRILPNVTAGYALTRKTRIAANYFFLRDQYDLRNKQLSRNFQSVGGRIDHDFKISEKTTLTTGFFDRVLFINTVHQPGIVFNDLLPSAVLTRRVTGGVVYGSFIGQLRFRDILSKFQEGDQFYSLGGAWRKGKYTYLADTTLVTNFGNSHLRQGPNNQNIIMTFEAGRRILPGVTAFARAQPIFNIGANHSPGYAGFNFRIFGGLRAEVGKPPIFPIKLKS
jgi:hypothetical protein